MRSCDYGTTLNWEDGERHHRFVRVTRPVSAEHIARTSAATSPISLLRNGRHIAIVLTLLNGAASIVWPDGTVERYATVADALDEALSHIPFP